MVHNDGALLGRTPFTIDRPKAGQPPLDLVLKLSGFKDAPVRISPYTQEQLQITLTRRWTARVGASETGRGAAGCGADRCTESGGALEDG